MTAPPPFIAQKTSINPMTAASAAMRSPALHGVGDQTMSELTEFSNLVADIYDASLDPALWKPVFEQICRFLCREPAMAERMKILGMDLQENGTEDYVRFMKDDLGRYEKVIDRLDLRRR